MSGAAARTGNWKEKRIRYLIENGEQRELVTTTQINSKRQNSCNIDRDKVDRL